MKNLDNVSSVLAPHENIALQFSGGKDSLAVAYLLRPYWDRLTFYHVDAGDLLPEVREIVDMVAAEVPRFVHIHTDSAQWMADVGLPSDIVPTTSTPCGLMIGASTQRIVDRFECCHHNLWVPMHQRMAADAVTLTIRGTKRADLKKLPTTDGPTGLGYDLWLPILEWSHEDVFAYLREVGAPICRVYEHNVQAPECARCPAWWSEGRAAYLKKHHPGLFADYRAKLAIVAREVTPHWQALMVENG